ncbi:MAG: acyl-ACP--UDP-N-acetylglucosamine O-acyltransferase [Candidatus Omnitrophota bacterium]
MSIHKTAIVSKKAKIAQTVEIGPYVVVEDGVNIGKGTKIGASSFIYTGTTIGEDCRIYNNVSLGGEPQDLSYKKGTEGFLKVGDRNTFREYATAHRAAKPGAATIIGNDNYFMALSHIAHDCNIRNNVVVCNNTLLAGHVEVGDRAFISGGCVIHQFVRIGSLAMIGGGIRVKQDIPPFMLTQTTDVVDSYNVVGIKRAGFSQDIKNQIRQAYKIIYTSGLNTTNALKELEARFDSKEIISVVEFIKASKRGIAPKNTLGRNQRVGSA